MDKEKTERPEEAFMKQVGFNSLTHYQFCHFIWMDDDYENIMEKVVKEWERLDTIFTMP